MNETITRRDQTAECDSGEDMMIMVQSQGWTPEKIGEHDLLDNQMIQSGFIPLDVPQEGRHWQYLAYWYTGNRADRDHMVQAVLEAYTQFGVRVTLIRDMTLRRRWD